MLLVTFTLVVFGALIVYSASWDFSLKEHGSPTYLFSRQMKVLVLGIGAALFCALLDYHYWRKLAVPAMAFTIFGLVAVLLVGEGRLGSVRALSAGSYMPGELAKWVVVVYLSVWLFSKRNMLSDKQLGLIPLGIMIGFISGLIMLQPDLSAAATIIFIGGLMFFLAGGDLRQISILVIVVLVMGWIIVNVFPTGERRIAEFMEGIRDPTSSSYHVLRSLEAFVKGGWFGVGIGQGETKLTGLPVPHTDSIFAVVGEETGLVGASVLVLLYLGLVWRGLVIAKHAPDMLGSLLAAGMSLWIAMEALVNMAVMVGLVPFAGNALPFISAGGSNLMVSLMAVGMMMNVARVAKLEEKGKGRSVNAAVDLRRGQRRRRVSGAGGTAGSR